MITIQPLHKEGDIMSTITSTDTKSFQRHTALRILGLGDGITRSTELSEEFQQLFGLTSSDPDEFVQNLLYLREKTADPEALEAAYYALGIDDSGTEEQRHNALLFKRVGRSHWDTSDIHSVEIDRIRGFNIVAASYDMAMGSRMVANAARAAANSQSVPVNLRRQLNLALLKLDALD